MIDSRLILWLDSVADFRRAGGGRTPDPQAVALLAELGGIDGIGFALPEGERESRGRDVRLLRETTATTLDLALVPVGDLASIAFDVRPHRVTLVPESRGVGSTNSLDAHLLKDALRRQVRVLRDADLEVGLRVEPGLEQVKALHRIDAQVAVLTADAYLTAEGSARRTEFVRLTDAATLASRLGLRVGVIGALKLVDIEAVARIAQIDEFHVGHTCVARSMLRGIERAIGDFASAMRRGRARAQ